VLTHSTPVSMSFDLKRLLLTQTLCDLSDKKGNPEKLRAFLDYPAPNQNLIVDFAEPSERDEFFFNIKILPLS